MPTPTHDDQGQRLLADADYKRLIDRLSADPDQFDQLDPDTQAAFRATRRYHFQQSQADFSMEGMDVGGKPVSEVLAQRRSEHQETRMEPSWKQADVFPIIARIIEQEYQEHQQFITAQQIATRLLQDTEGRNLVEAAREQQEEKQSLDWLASNMVSWFSQRITIGTSEWAKAFERTKIEGHWAYKPIATGDSCKG